MTEIAQRRQTNSQRRPWWAALLLLALLLPACLRDDDEAPTATLAIPTASSVATQRALPSMPVARLTPTATATVPPTPSPVPELETPLPTPSPAPIPAGQEEDLPDLTLAYAIDATLADVERGLVEAVSRVTIVNREDGPLDRLFFRVAPAATRSFVLNRLMRDGLTIEALGSDEGTTLEVTLDPALMPGATTVVVFDFTLALPDVEGGESIGRDGDVLRLGYWYPMLSNDDGFPPLLDPPYTLIANYDVSFTAPPEVVVAASGALTEPPRTDANGTQYRFSLENGRDFALMLSTTYMLDERTTASGIVVRQYTLASEYGTSDAERTAIRDRVFAVAERSLAEYATRIGSYPWPSLALVEAGPSLGGGIEYTALTIISYDAGGLNNLVAHEIAHMWFYAAIGTRTQAEPWIDEGAATFLGNAITSGSYAQSSDHGTINYVAPLGASVDDLSVFNDGQWIMAVYTQGGSFFADVYLTMGAEPFWSAMQDVYANQHFAILTPWELLTAFQQHSPVDLRRLYERYVVYEWLDDVR